MKNLLLLACLCISTYSFSQWQIGSDIDGEAANDLSGFSVSMADTNTVAIGAPGNAVNGANTGHVRVYERVGSSWVQKGIDIDGTINDFFGFCVSMADANTMAIGAIGPNSNTGQVKIFEWNGSAWVQKGLDIDGEATGDRSGRSVSMPDSNTVAIGAWWNDGNGTESGHTRVYEWNGSAWIQKGIDIDGEATGDRSGYSVSMPDANTLAIGAIRNGGNGASAGHVRIFEWNGTAWIQKGLDIDGEAAGDSFGWSVSMPDINTVAIGARNNDGNGLTSGHVRVFEWNGSAWVQKGADIDGEAAGDGFGTSVSMADANNLAIGSQLNSDNGASAGHVRIFSWDGSSWSQKGFDIDGEAAGDQSGYSVSMADTNTLAVGAANNDGNGSSSGHTRVFNFIDPCASNAVAAFTANPTNGTTIPHTVFFTDQSTLPDTWFWDFGDANTSTAQNPIHTYTAFGTYQVRLVVTDTVLGCIDTAFATVTINSCTAFSASMTAQSNVSCNGGSDGSLTVTQTGGAANFDYDWSNLASTTNSASNTNTITGLSVGTYTVTITDANSCTTTASATITEPTALNSSIISQVNVSCNGGGDGSAIASASGGVAPYTYNWSSLETTATISNKAAGTYTVSVTDANSCGPSVSTVTISQPSQIGASITPLSFINCNGDATGSAIVNASGGTTPYTYNWSTSANVATVSGLTAGSYTVTVTDANGCSAISSATFNQPSALVTTLNSTLISCHMGNDGSASANVTGGTTPYTYNWSNSGSSSSISNLTFGTYRLTVTDANGCTNVDSVLVNQANPLSAIITPTDISCFGQSDGRALVSLTLGGTQPYNYNWSNSGNTAQILNLSAGTYTVTVTDLNGCTYVDSTFINMPAALSSSVRLDSNARCFNSTDGGATAQISGGTTPYTFNWSATTFSDSILFSVGRGIYTVTVIDANGCSIVDSVLINVIDTTDPIAVAQNINVYLDLGGNAIINGNDIDGGSTDNCSIANLSADPNTFDCTDLGLDTIDLIVVDTRGNRDVAVSIVNVVDTFFPTAIAQDITVFLDINRTVVVDALLANNGSSDNCGITNYWLSDSTFSCANEGLNQVDFYVSDAQGNIDSTQIVINIIDTSQVVSTSNAAVCDGYFWTRSGQNYINSGVYSFYDTLGSCDTIFNLDLEVRPLDINMVNVGDSLFAFAENATYQWYDCLGDSIIPGATSRGLRPDTTGFYAVIVDNGICSDTAVCQEVIVVGIAEADLSKAKLNLYPNPTTNDFFFETDRFDKDSELIIYDMKGSIILRSRVDESREKIETDNWNAGIYFVRFGDEVLKLVLSR
ncbi:MAG: hypothetical protein CMP59_10105 [Flavobacteriales bacterium]|nr:hypothetical protein [Flavobacteriales bacterium]